ncbi:uncharacterized protein LOC123559263 [Mercenaria mercenaria]|uniref:uncharacterized protein LOC123559263 n=1 Tax=Mercenaria mercenaria TaxID=6596 RepID=UPI00234EF6DE|nr:uncharacterized protein LOC123559263 [Mercenaria mercenaria]
MIIRNFLDFLFILLLLPRAVNSQSKSCKEDSVAGPDNPKDFNKDFDKDKGYGYVVYGDLYKVDCCGTVKQWQFSIGDNGNIELQIWRPSDKKNKQFKLIGLNKYTVTKKDRKSGYVTFDVNAKDRLSVEENDVIGWYAPGDSLVDYTDGTSNDGIWKVKHDDKLKTGDTVDFSGGLKQSSRTYGIQAALAPNTPPEFDLLLATSISMNAEIGSTVYTVEVKDADPADVKDLKVEMLTKNDFFAFDPKTGVLSVRSEITVPEGGDVVTFDFKVTDHCGAEGTGSLTVHIDYVASRPTFPPRTVTDAKPTTVTDAKTTRQVKTTLQDKTTKEVQTTKTTKSTKTTKDSKTTKSKQTTKTSVTTNTVTATDSNTVKDKTTATSVPPTDQEPSNRTLVAPNTGSSVDAGLIAGIAAGIVGLIIIIVVTVVCVANKKAKIRPTRTDPEKANHKPQDSNTNKDNKEKQTSPDKRPPTDSKAIMNGKPHVKDKG